VAKTRVVLTCGACRQQVSRWVGRCPGCGAWGTIEEAAAADGNARRLVSAPLVGGERDGADRRVRTGFDDVDRVLGGGLVPASVSLLPAGGIATTKGAQACASTPPSAGRRTRGLRLLLRRPGG
jgi:predicted ATP-dependent serine protease